MCSAPNQRPRKAETMEAKTPAKRALAAVKAGAPAEPIDKQLRITDKVRRAIDLLATGDCKTQQDAAIKVGLAPANRSAARSVSRMSSNSCASAPCIPSPWPPDAPQR